MYINNLLFRTAQLWPDRIAIDTGMEQRSWATTLDRVRRLASGLAALSREGERVAVLGLNSGGFVELTLAIPLAPRPMMTLNYRLSTQEMEHMLVECPCSVLCFDEDNLPMATHLSGIINARFVYWGREENRPAFAISCETLIADYRPCEIPALRQSDTWAIISSGGTTGLPKWIQLSHGAMAFTVASTIQVLDLGPEPRGLHVAPLFHLAGFTAHYALTATGGTHAFLPHFSVDGLLDSLARHRCTLTNLVPTMISWLVAREDLDQFDLSALRNILYGASPISEATLTKLMTLFPGLQLNQFYGQTEACGALSCLLPEDHAVPGRLKSAGRPLPGVHVEILGPDGQAVPRGEDGEICGRTDALFDCYIAHPEQTADAKRAGWLHTGDIGHMDEDGYVFVTDRLKDMIVTGGENVSAGEVEQVIAQVDGVVQVAVVAGPDEVWGERVHAFVVIGEQTRIDTQDLDRFCRSKLAGYKIPRGYTLQTEPLPVTGAGKIRKDILRAQLRVQSATEPQT